MDGHMIMCKRKSDVDLGYVGEIEKVNTTLIDHLLADSFIPVIATVGMDDNGVPYNITPTLPQRRSPLPCTPKSSSA